MEEEVEVLNHSEAAADDNESSTPDAHGSTDAVESQDGVEIAENAPQREEVEGSSSRRRSLATVSGMLSRLQGMLASLRGDSEAELDTGEEFPCLGCVCGHPCTFSEDVITQKQSTLESHVYSYMLDVFDDVEAPAYSATNPNDNRFDVVCFKPDKVKDRVHISGQATPEHSWYPPYLWRFVSCLQCRTLLGWAFYLKNEEQGSISRDPVFFGLIVTNLRPQKSKIPSQARLKIMRTSFEYLEQFETIRGRMREGLDNADDSVNLEVVDTPDAETPDDSLEESDVDNSTNLIAGGEVHSMETEDDEEVT